MDVLPITSADLAQVPGKLLRPWFEAFRLQVAVDKAEEKVDVGVVLLPETINDVRVITDQVVSSAEPRDGSDPLTVGMAAPGGVYANGHPGGRRQLTIRATLPLRSMGQ
ncbi:hypothetical protein [Nocardiopsis rhodophaea]|uniref:hypothetical protein n=1 Tax=Nocardiopsis rhodophaea TaxID=280238 RepID=UPI0031DE6FE8